jgi:cysteine desulfurase
MLYLDHNATAPLCEAARTAWMEAKERFYANPSSLHRAGQRAEHALESARESLAEILGCPPSQVVWTSGATEAANAVLASLAFLMEGVLLISPTEHPCVLEPAKRWFAGRLRFLSCDRWGRVDAAEIEEMLRAEAACGVVVMAANNESGVLQPWARVAEICARAGVPFVCDATQWIGRLSPAGLEECSYVFGSTHKVGGPVGTGFLKLPTGGKDAWRALLLGGAQEEGRRAGTQDVAGALALIATLRDRQRRLSETGQRTTLRTATEEALKTGIPGIEIVGEGADRLWNTISVLLPPPLDCRRRWVVRLDAAGVAASSGSACASGKEAPSHVLSAMGLEKCADRVVRLSGGWETSREDWQRAVSVLQEVALERGFVR